VRVRFEIFAGHLQAINHCLLFCGELEDALHCERLMGRVKDPTDNAMLKVL